MYKKGMVCKPAQGLKGNGRARGKVGRDSLQNDSSL